MVTRILHNSERLGALFDQLELTLYQSQRQHILNMADALLVCEEDKTLAALQRQFVEAPDASNMADCLRISPWQADDVRAVLRANQVAWVVAQAERVGIPKMRDCSEGAGLPPTSIYRIFRGLTFERGGQPDVRSRSVPPRPKRRDHGARSPAAARDRPVQSQRHPATVSTLWSLGFPGQAVSSNAARLGQSRRVVSACSDRHVVTA